MNPFKHPAVIIIIFVWTFATLITIFSDVGTYAIYGAIVISIFATCIESNETKVIQKNCPPCPK